MIKKNYDSIFEKIAKFSISNAWQFIVLFLIIALASLYYISNNLTVHTDTQDMISSTLDWRQDYIKYQKAFPLNHKTIIAIIEGETKASVDSASSLLFHKLKENKNFISVFNYTLDDFFQSNQLLYANTESLVELSRKSQIFQPISDIRYHELARFIELLSNNLDNARSPFNQAYFYKSFEHAIKMNMLKKSSFVDWGFLHSDHINTKSTQIIQIVPNIDYQTLKPGLLEVNQIKKAFHELQLDETYNVQLKLTGEIVLNLEELQSVDKATKFTAVAAFLMVALLLLISFRSLPILIISLGVLIVGLILTAGMATLVVGHLNMISVAFAILYIGLSIDFTIHIIMHYKEQKQDSHSMAISDTIKQLSPALFFCALTTASAFYAFIPTSFLGISELGIIAGNGMIISFIINITLLPALLSKVARPQYKLSPSILPKWTYFPERHALSICLLFTLLIGVSFYYLSKVQFNNNPIDLKDKNQPSVIYYHELQDNPLFHVDSINILQEKSQDFKDLNQQLTKLSSVKEIRSLDSFIPQDQSQKIQIIKKINQSLKPIKSQKKTTESSLLKEHALKKLSQKILKLKEISVEQMVLVNTIDTFLKFVEQQPVVVRDLHYQALSHTTLLGLQTFIDTLHLSKTAFAFTIDDLPAELKIRWENQDYKRLQVVPAYSMKDRDKQNAFVEDVSTYFPNATGLPVIHKKAGHAVVVAFEQAFLIALCIMILFLIVLMRDFKKIILTLVPLVSACILTGGLCSLFNISFNFANIIALPLLLGIGIDNGIHLVHRFYDSTDNKPILASSTSRAVLISTLTTIFSFANLSFSPHLGMSSMGLMLGIGMTVTFFCTLIFFPALLTMINGKTMGG